MPWLYRYESKGIQRWILDSNQLRDLAAGSILVEDLVHQAVAGIPEEDNVISAAAGGMTARFRTREELAKFASEWPMRVAHLAPGLQIVQAWMQYDESDEGGRIIDLLRRELAKQRNFPAPPAFEAGPLVARSGRTGMPAVRVPPALREKRPQQLLWDAATVSKERMGQRARRSSEHKGVLDEFTFEENLDAWRESAVGVVHADGSGVGKRLLKVDDVEVAKRFATALSDATKKATRIAVASLPIVNGCRIARPVVVGGDDLTFILPASDTLQFVETWLTEFERATEESREALGGNGLHAGAGVVFVHRAFPFATAYEHAEHECRQAKRTALSPQGDPEASVVRFRRVTVSRIDDSTSKLWRSWKLGEFAGLRELQAAVDRLPRGTLRTWLTLVDRRDVQRDALWRRMAEVADPAVWQRFQHALERLGADPANGLKRDPQDVDLAERQTPVRDALALLQLGRARRGG